LYPCRHTSTWEIIFVPRGILYRGGPESEMPRGLSAWNILCYEIYELGNEITSKLSKSELKNIKSNRLMWVAKTEEDAEEFGDVEEIEIDYRIIATDPYGGLLIEEF